MAPTKSARQPKAKASAAWAAPAAKAGIAPARGTLESFRGDVRFLIVIVAVLLIAAGQSLSIDRETEPVFYGAPDLTTSRSNPSAEELLPPSAPLASPVPAQVTVVTVPVQQPDQRPIIIRESPPANAPAATTRTTLPRYENGGTPPVVRITRLGPQNQDAGRPIELTFQAGDSDGVISGWIIDWGDGTTSADAYDDRCGPPPGEPDHEFPPQRHTYREVGQYEVNIRVVSRGTCNSGPIQRADDRSAVNVGPAILNSLPVA